MAVIAFLRGVNVGGHRTFQPSQLARDLSPFGVVNVGAAGTLVARRVPNGPAFRAALLEKLPFEASVAIVPASQLLALARSEPFPEKPPGPLVGRGPGANDVRRMLSVLLAKPKPKAQSRLPILRPEGPNWQVALIGVTGRLVVWFWRANRESLKYTDAVEKEFGVPATSRSWNTVEKIRKILEDG
jgi:uncharacterized protein (DUF1697 family)